MNESRPYAWSNRGLRWSVVSLILVTLATVLIGFVWLPSVHGDFSAGGIWASICRAAGVPAAWYGPQSVTADREATRVVLERAMTHAADKGSAGRGATLALNQCTMCHGALGTSMSNAPNLAGQYPEVVIKQLLDYKAGTRMNAVMEALAKGLSDMEIRDLAAYYGSLPKARTAPTRYDESLPALVRVGAPMRNIPPCIACHGGVDQKLGAPWIEGMPKDYLVAQLMAFKSGERRNDSQSQMRSVARTMTQQEIDEVATFYARKAAAAGIDQQ
jgi:cytochrome c553